MPPLFLYAIVFLAVLTAVTFVLAHRDDSGAGTQANPAGPQPRPVHAEAIVRRDVRPSETGLRRVDAPISPAAAEGSGVIEAAVTDRLALQVAELTRQVAELQAEQQASREEIGRLRQALAATPPAPVRSLKTVWPVEGEARIHRIGA
ncbi:MAG TPA: hypothetical protein VHL98_07035 [Microvirga sp.]|jgi:hypothetical protein|nr:hypothetical protein [Microvirga sp.]